MRRNRIILMVILLIALMLLLPKDGTGYYFRAYAKLILPYIIIGVILYLAIMIRKLRKSFYQAEHETSDEAVFKLAENLNRTFDVKRVFGKDYITASYRTINDSTEISIATKQALYEAIRRKKLDIPLPSAGRKKRAKRKDGEYVPHSAGKNKGKHRPLPKQKTPKGKLPG